MEMENVVEIEVEVEEGKQGLSAYEIYLNSGGTLSEEEWLLSLKGEKGDTGENGITPTIGENGNWFIGDTDTGMPSKGADGEDGDGSGAVTILAEDDDATIVEKLMSVIEDGREVQPLFYRSNGGDNEIAGIYELFQSYTDDNGRTFIFICFFSNVYMVRFTVSSDNTLTKVALKSSWSDITGVKEITGQLENLNTEDKTTLVNAINEVASNSGGCSIYNISTASTLNDRSIKFGTTVLNELTEIINKNLDETFILFINSTSNNNKLRFELRLKTPTSDTSNVTNNVYGYSFYEAGEQDTKKKFILKYNTYSNGTISVTQFNSTTNPISELTSSSVLTKTNTTSYTPTSDYHPATKKYVDDLVGDISTVLATLTTVSEVSE